MSVTLKTAAKDFQVENVQKQSKAYLVIWFTMGAKFVGPTKKFIIYNNNNNNNKNNI